MKQKFTHLHVHSHYSLLDGIIKIDDLVERASKSGMHSIALTDHGNMMGIMEFYTKAVKKGVKPIVGSEFYLAIGSRFDKIFSRGEKSNYHLLLLAKNNTGYKNLIKLSSYSFLEGFYRKPRIDKELLKEYSEGIIGLSACLAGELSQLILNQKFDEALVAAKDYTEIFGEGNFYLEVMDHLTEKTITHKGIKFSEQQFVNRGLLEIHKLTGIPLVASNDVHFINREDSLVHNVFLCIQTKTLLNEQSKMKSKSNEPYLKNAEEMRELFKDYPGAADNTHEIALKCNVSLGDKDKYIFPNFKIEKDISPDAYLRELVEQGIKRRYKDITESVRERVEEELAVIKEVKFARYFLIVWDFIRFARNSNI
ncbi:MAG: PHP domain-containing protein, partial [Actinomycetia bacterium]|nr:PHP domain-containing protein [Actinomycetes bacterium]